MVQRPSRRAVKASRPSGAIVGDSAASPCDEIGLGPGAVEACAVDARLAVALRVEDGRLSVRCPRRRAVPSLVVREPAHVGPVGPHRVQLAGQVCGRGGRPSRRRHRRVAAAREEDPRAVGREGWVVVARRVARQVLRLARPGGVLGLERHHEDVRIAAPGADEEQLPPVGREVRGVLQRGASDQRPRWAVDFEVERVQVRAPGPFRGEHHPTPVGRDDGVVVEARIRRQSARFRAGFVEEVPDPSWRAGCCCRRLSPAPARPPERPQRSRSRRRPPHRSRRRAARGRPAAGDRTPGPGSVRRRQQPVSAREVAVEDLHASPLRPCRRDGVGALPRQDHSSRSAVVDPHRCGPEPRTVDPWASARWSSSDER